MIIKFQEKNRWVIFGEIDHVEYETGGACGNTGIESDVICYAPPNTPAVTKEVSMLFFTKNMTAPTRINAHSPIYLMNDNGKTIEII